VLFHKHDGGTETRGDKSGYSQILAKLERDSGAYVYMYLSISRPQMKCIHLKRSYAY
jgi:hypothetical protein